MRYSIPGDWVMVETDGSLTLLGRGNACINTAGEKVFPEEVEEALKTHPSIEDALVVGLPDEKWGQAVTGVVQLAEGHELDEAALRAHVRKSLAGYKTPEADRRRRPRAARRQRQGRLPGRQGGGRSGAGGSLERTRCNRQRTVRRRRARHKSYLSALPRERGGPGFFCEAPRPPIKPLCPRFRGEERGRWDGD